MKIFAVEHLLNWLLIFVPIAIVLELTHARPVFIFAASCLAIIPLAGLMGKATEHLAERMGEGIGGLLNATFGNAAELIIALDGAATAGSTDVVKASITGSIIGNILLVFGSERAARRAEIPGAELQPDGGQPRRHHAGARVIGLLVPALFHQRRRRDSPNAGEQELSLEIAIVLMVTYVLSLVFTLKTHKHLYAGGHGAGADRGARDARLVDRSRSVTLLLVATAFVALMSEFLVGAVEETAQQLRDDRGLRRRRSLVAIIGNAAEHSTAVLMAMKNKMDLAINIAVGSPIQIALFVAPVLVFPSYVIGPQPMDLLFTPFEVLAIALSVGIIALISQDGESNWMEGVQLLAVYAILGIAFYFLPG